MSDFPAGSDEAYPETSAVRHGSECSRKLKEHAVEEGRRFLWMFLYLWVSLALFALQEFITLHERGLSFATQGFIFINALVLAKVMLIVEGLNLGRWLRDSRLIYKVVFESFIFTVIFIAFHVVEKVTAGLIAGEKLAASVPHIGGGGIPGLLCVAAIFFVMLLPYFAFTNMSQALGPGRLKALLFEAREKAAEGD